MKIKNLITVKPVITLTDSITGEVAQPNGNRSLGEQIESAKGVLEGWVTTFHNDAKSLADLSGIIEIDIEANNIPGASREVNTIANNIHKILTAHIQELLK